jgi:hypothetical protein
MKNTKLEAIKTINKIFKKIFEDDFSIFKDLCKSEYKLIEESDDAPNYYNEYLCSIDFGPNVEYNNKNEKVITTTYKHEITLKDNLHFYLLINLFSEYKAPMNRKSSYSFFVYFDNAINKEHQTEKITEDPNKIRRDLISFFKNNIDEQNILKLLGLYSRMLVDLL